MQLTPTSINPSRSMSRSRAVRRQMLVEIKPVASFKCRNIEEAVAHQVLDRIGADEVVLIERQPAHYGQAAGIQSGVVARQVARVLAEGGADVRDRAHAQSDQVAVAMGRVALEIALQRAGVLRLRKVIAGASEVVHANIAIACGRESLDTQAKQSQARCGIGQIGSDDLARCC